MATLALVTPSERPLLQEARLKPKKQEQPVQ